MPWSLTAKGLDDVPLFTLPRLGASSSCRRYRTRGCHLRSRCARGRAGRARKGISTQVPRPWSLWGPTGPPFPPRDGQNLAVVVENKSRSHLTSLCYPATMVTAKIDVKADTEVGGKPDVEAAAKAQPPPLPVGLVSASCNGCWVTSRRAPRRAAAAPPGIVIRTARDRYAPADFACQIVFRGCTRAIPRPGWLEPSPDRTGGWAGSCPAGRSAWSIQARAQVQS